MYRFPTYQELSKEQDRVFNLPLDGHHIVVGPPGTGKTILAVYRAEMYLRSKKSVELLMYNRTLKQHVMQGAGISQVDCDPNTFYSWFSTWYRNEFHRQVPQIQPYEYDWSKILAQVQNSGRIVSHIIIDEGQDFPKEFYLLLKIIAEHVTVFADENQRIKPQNSTIKDICNFLQVKTPYRLTKNYRNTNQIARFSQCFYADLESGMPELPARQGSKPTLFILGNGQKQETEVLVNYISNNRDKQVGVFARTTRQQNQLFNRLRCHLHQRGLPNHVQKYVSTDNDFKELDFTKPGAFVLTYASAKGLEFDTVFLPGVEDTGTDPANDIERMQYYVLASRARSELILMTNKDAVPQFINHIPQDLYQIRYLAGR